MDRLPELIDALVARWRTDDGLTDVEVTDGPLVTSSSARDWVMVGYDGNDDGEFQAATTEEDWAGLGVSRAQTIHLTVGIVCRRGDNQVKAARDRAYQILAVLVSSLRADPSVGLPQTQVALASTTLHQEPTSHGACARLILSLTAETFT